VTALAAQLARWLVFPEQAPLPESICDTLRGAPGIAELANCASDHGLLGLWHYRARQSAGSLPEPLARAAADAYHANLARSAYYYRELAQVLSAARATGIEPLLLKGAHLAATLYPAVATRPMMDVDLLVSRSQVDRLVSALVPLGFHEVERDPRARVTRDFEIQTIVARHGARDYCRFAVHWDLLDAPFYESRLPLDAMRARAVPCDTPGGRVQVLAREDLLVYLAAHGAFHHQWARQIWLCDLALVLAPDSPALDWQRVAALAEASALTLAVTASLRRVCADFALELPEHVWRRFEAARVGADERAIFAELTVPNRGAGRRFAADLRSMRGARARLVFALAHLFPSPGYMRRRYALSNKWALPVAYLRRWLSGLTSLRSPPKGL
jgi:hypothetical protein